MSRHRPFGQFFLTVIMGTGSDGSRSFLRSVIDRSPGVHLCPVFGARREASPGGVRVLKVLTRTHAGVLVGAVFGLAGLTVAMLNTHPRGGRMGIALLIVGAVLVTVSELRAHLAPGEQSYRMGYDAGYELGRRVGKPVVVPLRGESRDEGEGESRVAR